MIVRMLTICAFCAFKVMISIPVIVLPYSPAPVISHHIDLCLPDSCFVLRHTLPKWCIERRCAECTLRCSWMDNKRLTGLRDQLDWNGYSSPEQNAMARGRRWPMLHRERWALVSKGWTTPSNSPKRSNRAIVNWRQGLKWRKWYT